MAFEFEEKPQQPRAAGARNAQAEQQPAAEVVAERRRVFDQSTETARRRRERIAAVQGGRLPRGALDASERILLESYERKEETEQRPGFFERLARRVAGSGLGALIGSIITGTASLPNSCTGATNPLLARLAMMLGGVGLLVLAVAAVLWLYRYLFL